MNGVSIQSLQNKETLTSKIIMELEKMNSIVKFKFDENKKEKREIQEMVSEITHQIKTPVFSCPFHIMVNPYRRTAVNRNLYILMSSFMNYIIYCNLIKSSRLETEMINLEPADNRIIETLAVAVNDIIHKAGHKNIEISVETAPFSLYRMYRNISLLQSNNMSCKIKP